MANASYARFQEEPMMAAFDHGIEPEPCAASFTYTFDSQEMFGGVLVAGNGLAVEAVMNPRTRRWKVEAVLVGHRNVFNLYKPSVASTLWDVVADWLDEPESQATIQRAAEADEERRVADHEDEPDGRGE